MRTIGRVREENSDVSIIASAARGRVYTKTKQKQKQNTNAHLSLDQKGPEGSEGQPSKGIRVRRRSKVSDFSPLPDHLTTLGRNMMKAPAKASRFVDESSNPDPARLTFLLSNNDREWSLR
jgi:hypothetical protein